MYFLSTMNKRRAREETIRRTVLVSFVVIAFNLVGLIYPEPLASEKYTRKSITYLKMVLPPHVVRISNTVDFLTGFDLASYLEKKVREAVEMPRFDYNPVALSGSTDIEALAKLVKEYVDEVKVDRAKAEAKLDWRYKDVVVTAEDIRRIAESAYIYYPEIKRFRVDLLIYMTRENGKNKIEKEIIVDMALKINYWRVDFDTGKPIKVAEIHASHVERVKVGRFDLVPLPFPFSLLSPSVSFPETSFQAFARCSEQVIYWLARKINREMRKIPDFKLFGPVESVSFREAYVPLTKRDGVYLDSDFEVVEEVEVGGNGRTERRRVGWVRARKIADEKKGDTLSAFQILGGSVHVGQLVREFPLLGIGISPSAFYMPGDGRFGLSFLAHISLPRTFSIRLSELYILTGPQLSFSETLSELAITLGLRRKFYIRSLGLNPQLLLSFSRVYRRIGEGEYAQETYGDALGVLPAFDLEWFFSPRFSVFIGGGYRALSELEPEHRAQGGQKISGFFVSAGLELTIW